jgi:hypothetical protein
MKANILVLTLVMSGCIGLVSCSPDKKKETQEFKLPEPVINKGSGRVSWIPFSLSDNRSLDLTDRLEFKSAPQGSLSIEASCTSSRQSFLSKQTIPVSKIIAVYEFFEPKLLVKFGPNVDATCALTFKGSNSSGSIQMFELQGVKITDNSANAPIQMTENGAIKKTDWIAYLDKTTTIQLQVEKFNRLTMQCPDVRYEQDWSSAEFAFTQLTAGGPIYETNENILLRNPAQRCRILAFLDKRLTGISRSFVYIHEKGLPTVVNAELKTEGSPLKDPKLFRIFRFVVTNPENFPIQVKIPKVLSKMSFQLVTNYRGSISTAKLLGSETYFSPGRTEISQRGEKTSVGGNENFYYIQLPEKEMVTIDVVGSPNVVCQNLVAATVKLTEPLAVYLVEDLGFEILEAPLGSFDLNVPFYFGQQSPPELYNIYRHEGRGTCN